MTHSVNTAPSSSQGIELRNLPPASASRDDVAAFERTLSPASEAHGGGQLSSGSALTNHQNPSMDTPSNLYDSYGAGSHSPATQNPSSASPHSSVSSLGLPIQGHDPAAPTPHAGAEAGTTGGSSPTPVGADGAGHGNGAATGPHFAANHSDAEMGIGSGPPAHTEAPNAGTNHASQPAAAQQQPGRIAAWAARNYTFGDRIDKATKPYQLTLAVIGAGTGLGFGGFAAFSHAIKNSKPGP